MFRRKKLQDVNMPSGNLAAASSPRREFKAQLKDEMLQSAFPHHYKPNANPWSAVIFGGAAMVTFASFAIIVFVITQPNGLFSNRAPAEIVAVNQQQQVLDNIYANNTVLSFGQVSEEISPTVVAQETARVASQQAIKPTTTAITDQVSNGNSNMSTPSANGIVTIVTTETVAGPKYAACSNTENYQPAKLGTNQVITFKDNLGHVGSLIILYDESHATQTLSFYREGKIILYNHGKFAVRFTPAQTTSSATTASTSSATSAALTAQQLKEATRIEKTTRDNKEAYLITQSSDVNCNNSQLIVQTVADPQSYQVSSQEIYLGSVAAENLITRATTSSAKVENVTWAVAQKGYFELGDDVEIRDIDAPFASENERIIHVAQTKLFNNSKFLTLSDSTLSPFVFDINIKLLSQVDSFNYDSDFYAEAESPYAEIMGQPQDYRYEYEYAVAGTNSTIDISVYDLDANAPKLLHVSDSRIPQISVDGKTVTLSAASVKNNVISLSFNYGKSTYKIELPVEIKLKTLNFVSSEATDSLLKKFLSPAQN